MPEAEFVRISPVRKADTMVYLLNRIKLISSGISLRISFYSILLISKSIIYPIFYNRLLILKEIIISIGSKLGIR